MHAFYITLVNIFFYLSIYLTIYLSVYLSTYLFIYLYRSTTLNEEFSRITWANISTSVKMVERNNVKLIQYDIVKLNQQ